jgi:hypothetical protein
MEDCNIRKMGCHCGKEDYDYLRDTAMKNKTVSRRNYFNGRLKESQIKKNIIEEQNLKLVIDDIFDRFDKNGDGYL